MKADRDRIRAYYAQGLEDGRLASDDGWFELERTVRIVKGLVPAGSRVVDLGGGPGRLSQNPPLPIRPNTLPAESAFGVSAVRSTPPMSSKPSSSRSPTE
jgi:hypothetical protein